MVDGRNGVLLREVEALWLRAPTPEGVTDVPLGRAKGSGVAVTELDILRAFLGGGSGLTDGAMLLLDLLVNFDTCVALLLGLIGASSPRELAGSLDDDVFFVDGASSFCGGCLKWDRNVDAIVRLRQAAHSVSQTIRGSRGCSLGHMLCNVVSLVLCSSFRSGSH